MVVIVLGVAILVIIIVWLKKDNENKQDTLKYYVGKYSNPNSQVVLFGQSSCLGFNLESKMVGFANWQTYRGYNLYEKFPSVDSNTCKFSDDEPVDNIKEFCIVGTSDDLEPESTKRLYVYFYAKPRINSDRACLEASAFMYNKDIDKITKLIESAGLKVRRRSCEIKTTWGD